MMQHIFFSRQLPPPPTFRVSSVPKCKRPTCLACLPVSDSDSRGARDVIRDVSMSGIRFAYGRRGPMCASSHGLLTIPSKWHSPALQVNYPGLPDHPQHQLLTNLLNPGYGYGGILGLDMGVPQLADRVGSSCRLTARLHSLVRAFSV
jgi:hypothetical protein